MSEDGEIDLGEANDGLRCELDEPLEILKELVDALGGDFSSYGACCFVVDPHAVFGACGEPAHMIEFRTSGNSLFYCDDHVEQRPDPHTIQQLPHAPQLRRAQRLLKETGRRAELITESNRLERENQRLRAALLEARDYVASQALGREEPNEASEVVALVDDALGPITTTTAGGGADSRKEARTESAPPKPPTAGGEFP